MNILFITQIEPFPPNSGERIRSYHLINSILEFTDKLFLVAGNGPPDESRYSKIGYHQIPKIYSGNRWKNLLLLFHRNRRLVKIIKDILKDHEINCVFLDYHFIGQYTGIFRKKGIRIIYGTHNVQSHLNFQMPANNIKDILYKNIRYVLDTMHEWIYFRRADVLIGVSDEDLEYYKCWIKNTAAYLIPNYINEKEYQDYHVEVKKSQVIMTGNFYAFQNNRGLRWFLDEVWDEQLASLANFIIVGHGSIEHFNRIKQENAFVKNVRALGSVDDIKKHIAESKVAVIPLLHGSGTRLKCIEAMALKTNIIGTNLGLEGIEHNGSILIAENAHDFKSKLMKVLNNEIHNEEKVYDTFLRNYSSRSNTPKLKEIIIPNSE